MKYFSYTQTTKLAAAPVPPKKPPMPTGAASWTPMRALGVIGAGIIISEAAKRILDHVNNKFVLPKQREELFQKMLTKHPELLTADIKEVAQLWESLATTTPHIANDPVAAGAMIRQMLAQDVVKEYGGPTIDVYDTLTKIDNNISAGQDRKKPKFLNVEEKLDSLMENPTFLAGLSGGLA